METGTRTTASNTNDHLLDIEEVIHYLNPRHNGIRFVKKLLENGRNGKDKTAKSYKHEWHETSLPPRRETVTIAAGAVTLTVANSSVYPIGTMLRVDNEMIEVTARPSGTTLTVLRARLGTADVIHTASVALNLGYAGEEYGTGPEALSTNAVQLYNYVQTFEAAVEMSDKEIAQLSSEIGNPFSAQLERVTAFFWKTFAQSVFKGVRGSTTRNGRPVHYMGGIDGYLTTNVVNVGGAVSTTVIDTNLILPLVVAGGTPDVIVMSPKKFLQISALDTAAVRITKDETTGGNPIYKKWQSAASEQDLDLITDHSILDTEMYVLDTSKLAILPLENNGISGRLALVDGTTTGASGKRRILRAHYTLVVELEAGHAKAINLTA